MLRYGLGDLADIYRDRMTLRQLWVRIRALPDDSPLAYELAAMAAEAERDKQSTAIDEALNRFQRG